MTTPRATILTLEDDSGVTTQYRWLLSQYKVISAATRVSAMELFEAERPPLAIVDLGLPPDPDGATEGLAAVEQILRMAPETKVVVVTGNESKEHAVRAVALGAYDFFRKPIDPDVLTLILDRAIKLFELEKENRRLRAIAPRSSFGGIVASSPQMMKVLRDVERVARTDAAVLLLGESGTGKELIANALHSLSGRAQGPFVAINCAAIPETLLESELFGHEKGAFTGAMKQTIGKIESANGGTLFLDEIGDIPLSMQVKLLRFLEDKVVERIGGRQRITVNTRIVCATNQNLTKFIEDGRFREDLFYRINEITISIPPLREREGDAILLANYFLKAYGTQYSRAYKGFTPEAVAAMQDHAWRGNVRELENRVKRAAIMAEGATIAAADLDLAAPATLRPLGLQAARRRAEREVLDAALASAGGNLSRAATLLGISRPTLYDLLAEHGLETKSRSAGKTSGPRTST